MDNKKLKSSWAAAFTVASVWFGTHVGAGFATGNQVVNYFVQYGWTAAIFPLLAMGILAVVMYIMMKFAKLNGFDNYKDTYRALYPKPWMEIFFEIFYIIIILAAVASCVDGAGGIVKSLIDLPDIICNLVIIALHQGFHRSFHRDPDRHRDPGHHGLRRSDRRGCPGAGH